MCTFFLKRAVVGQRWLDYQCSLIWNEAILRLVCTGLSPLLWCRTNNDFWIGQNDMEVEGTLAYLDERLNECGLTPYTKWGSGQPNGDRRQNCIEYDHQGNHWEDRECDAQRSFLCKVNMTAGKSKGVTPRCQTSVPQHFFLKYPINAHIDSLSQMKMYKLDLIRL